MDNEQAFRHHRDPRIKYYATLVFTVLITVIGWIMMTLSSSPSMKGAAFLWLPAALQLVAGIWLGPWLGMVAGGVGAYAAGILAYGGWGLPDIIMNPIAGGLANSALPGMLFRAFKINPSLGSHAKNTATAIGRIVIMLVLILGLTLFLRSYNLGVWAYFPQFIILLLTPLYVKDLRTGGSTLKLLLAVLICITISAVSALIGSYGAHVGGLNWKAAFVTVGIGWFCGDAVSALFGLYMLAALTDKARDRGLVS